MTIAAIGPAAAQAWATPAGRPGPVARSSGFDAAFTSAQQTPPTGCQCGSSTPPPGPANPGTPSVVSPLDRTTGRDSSAPAVTPLLGTGTTEGLPSTPRPAQATSTASTSPVDRAPTTCGTCGGTFTLDDAPAVDALSTTALNSSAAVAGLTLGTAMSFRHRPR